MNVDVDSHDSRQSHDRVPCANVKPNDGAATNCNSNASLDCGKCHLVHVIVTLNSISIYTGGNQNANDRSEIIVLWSKLSGSALASAQARLQLRLEKTRLAAKMGT